MTLPRLELVKTGSIDQQIQDAIDASTQAIQSEIDAHEALTRNAHGGVVPAADRGIAGGVATLDATTGQLESSQIPASLLGASRFQSTWDANANTPNLGTVPKERGFFWTVNVSGSTSLSGITDWKIGDNAIYDGSVWRKIDNTDQVVSVDNRQGAVDLSDKYAPFSKSHDRNHNFFSSDHPDVDTTDVRGHLDNIAWDDNAKKYVHVAPGGVADASETTKGAVELATATETKAGTDSARAVHPAGLQSKLAPPAWIAPTLQNGWVNYGPGDTTAGYLLDALGFVCLKGLLKSGTIGSAFFTLPVGFRPSETYRFTTATGGSSSASLVSVNPDGRVVCAIGSNTFVAVDGVRFKAEQ